jgi:hypothetical protein
VLGALGGFQVLAAVLLAAAPDPAAAVTTAAPASPAAATGAAAGIEIAIAAGATIPAASVREDRQELLARRGLDARDRRLDAVDRDEVLRPAAQSPCSLACIWIDLGVAKPGRAFVYISATASDQVVIRSLPLPNGVDEVAREEVSHIVASSVEALQAGRPLLGAGGPADNVVAKVEPPPPPAPAPPEGGVWVSAGLGAGAARESGSHFALPTVGLSLLVGAERARLSPALWLQAAAFSSNAAGDPVALTFRGGELAALGAIGTSPHGRAAARLGLGLGLELRSTTPALGVSGASGVSLEPSQVDPTVFLRAGARFEYRLFSRVGLFAVAALDARVMSHRYTITTGTTTEPVYQPDRARPSIFIGFEALLAGEGAP